MYKLNAPGCMFNKVYVVKYLGPKGLALTVIVTGKIIYEVQMLAYQIPTLYSNFFELLKKTTM